MLTLPKNRLKGEACLIPITGVSPWKLRIFLLYSGNSDSITKSVVVP